MSSAVYLKNKWSKELIMRLQQSTTGHIYYVDGLYGNDSGSGLYPFDAKKTVQGGVDACTTNRGDIVIVGAGQYIENVRITKSKMTLMGATTGGKESVSIRAAGVGDSGATYAEPSTRYGYSSLAGVTIRGSCVTINAASVEVCNLQLDGSGFKYDGTNYSAHTGIYVGDGTRISSSYNTDSNGSYIHDCIFKRGAYGVNYDGASEDHRLMHNHFYRQEGATTKGCVFIGPGSSRQSTRITIKHNDFTAMENTSYGIHMYSSGSTQDCVIAHNVFAEHNGGSVTYAILIQGAGEHLVAGNWFGCTNKIYTSNTDWTSGNFIGTAGKAGAVTAFVTED